MIFLNYLFKNYHSHAFFISSGLSIKFPFVSAILEMKSLKFNGNYVMCIGKIIFVSRVIIIHTCVCPDKIKRDKHNYLMTLSNFKRWRVQITLTHHAYPQVIRSGFYKKLKLLRSPKLSGRAHQYFYLYFYVVVGIHKNTS